MYCIYILKSLKDNKTYVGYTNDLNKRLVLHNSGKVISTKYRIPFVLIFSEKFLTAKGAKKREIWWKSGSGRKKMKELFFNSRI